LFHTIKQPGISENKRYVIDILDLALKVIDRMAFDQEEYYSASSLAQHFNINRSRMFRILKTLDQRGYVDYDPATEAYRLGLKFLTVSQNIRARLSLRGEAEEILRDLAVETGDSTYLIIPSDGSAIVIDRYTGDNMLQLSAPIGSVLPYHIGAGPKLLLAFQQEQEREKNLAGLELTSFTPNTITNIDILRKTLAEIRRKGYAVDEQDYEIGAYAFGAPIFDHEGCVIAGISITTPAVRYSPTRREELIRQVVRAAQKLSEKLGYHTGRSPKD
jgi:DNA-binding IclR family transcriptional regulator